MQWRGSSEPTEGRAENVATVYQSGDAAQVEDVLNRYGVKYVLFGDRERTKYQVQSLDHLKPMLTPAFSHEGYIIYEVVDTDA